MFKVKNRKNYMIKNVKESILENFKRNCSLTELYTCDALKLLSEKLNEIKYVEDIIAQYDSEFESFDIRLYLPEDTLLSVSLFIEDADSEMAVFTLHSGNKLLIADEDNLSVIVENINKVFDEMEE